MSVFDTNRERSGQIFTTIKIVFHRHC